MKKINLEQGTEPWLAWRKTVITATDAPAILGSSPWTSAYKCWQKKLGLIDEQKSTEAMERGKTMEPEARAHFIERYGIEMEPAVVESSVYDFLGASLDGMCDREILEIKCGGTKLHTMASEGIIPQYYLDQIQHQLFVTGAERCYYYSYNGKDGICIEVLPDITFIDRFLPKARDFWRAVAFSEPPAMEISDYYNMNDNLDWQECSRVYQETDTAIKFLEEKKDTLRKKLIELCADQSCLGSGLRVMKTVMRGRVAYDEIPEIKNVDLDKYRKKSTMTWKIMIDQKT